jgi:hypothetical protein
METQAVTGNRPQAGKPESLQGGEIWPAGLLVFRTVVVLAMR